MQRENAVSKSGFKLKTYDNMTAPSNYTAKHWFSWLTCSSAATGA